MVVVGVDLKNTEWAVYDPGQMLRAVHLPFLQSLPPVFRESLKVGVLRRFSSEKIKTVQQLR